MPVGEDISIVRVDALDFSFVPRRWTFAEERRAAIEAHFDARRRATPQLWNGRALLLSAWALRGGCLSGEFFETDFASFLAWLDWDCPDRSVSNCFAMGALRASDGAFLLGVMGAHTANAGQVYFPSGTPDPSDVVGTKVDLTGSVLREMAEETGLTGNDFRARSDWICVKDGASLGLIKLFQSDALASDLRSRIHDYLAAEAQPELADIRIVRGPEDLDPMMPPFVIAFLRETWGRAEKERPEKSEAGEI
jgi:8-oxo-dGTP pyrophosphatase MutT (NUDIX family)